MTAILQIFLEGIDMNAFQIDGFLNGDTIIIESAMPSVRYRVFDNKIEEKTGDKKWKETSEPVSFFLNDIFTVAEPEAVVLVHYFSISAPGVLDGMGLRVETPLTWDEYMRGITVSHESTEILEY